MAVLAQIRKWSRLTPHSWQRRVVCDKVQEDEYGSIIREWFGVSCALIPMLNSVACTQITKIYLWSSCDARLMYARMVDLTGAYVRRSFKESGIRSSREHRCLANCQKYSEYMYTK